MNIVALQIHKRDSYHYKFIQDKYGINLTNKTFSIADGTTQSFRSEIWAELLTEYFVENPTYILENLISEFTKLSENFENLDFEFSSNPAKASLERAKHAKGGTSTLLAVQFLTQNKIRVVTCGDSNLFILNDETSNVTSYPFSNLESLDRNNNFLNTKAFIKEEVNQDFFQYTELELKENDQIMLATDALSRLILKNNSVIKEIYDLSNFEEFHEFCLKYWDAKELEEDDITAMIISPFKKNGGVKEIFPPDNFEFPKTETPEFVPTSPEHISPQTITAMQMNEIKNQFNGVANDFQNLKRSLRTNRLLMVLVIILLSLNITFLFLNTTKTKSPISNKVIEKSKKSNKPKKIKTIKEAQNIKTDDTNIVN